MVGANFDDNPLLEPAFKQFSCSIFPDTRIRTYVILIFGLILTFILALYIRELTLVSIPRLVLLQFCNYFLKSFWGFDNLK